MAAVQNILLQIHSPGSFPSAVIACFSPVPAGLGGNPLQRRSAAGTPRCWSTVLWICPSGRGAAALRLPDPAFERSAVRNGGAADRRAAGQGGGPHPRTGRWRRGPAGLWPCLRCQVSTSWFRRGNSLQSMNSTHNAAPAARSIVHRVQTGGVSGRVRTLSGAGQRSSTPSSRGTAPLEAAGDFTLARQQGPSPMTDGLKFFRAAAARHGAAGQAAIAVKSLLCSHSRGCRFVWPNRRRWAKTNQPSAGSLNKKRSRI